MALKARLPLWAWIVISIAIVAVCNVLNFSDMMMSNGSLSSLLITLAYILIWGTLTFLNRKNRRFLTFFCIFWSVCAASSVLGFCIYTDVVSHAILTTMGFFGLLFITPLVGFLFISDNLHFTYVALIFFSIACTGVGIALTKMLIKQRLH